MQESSHWRDKAGNKITLLRCFNCFGDELRLTTGPKQLPMGPPLASKPKAPLPLEQRLNQPYAIPDHIIKQQKERRLSAARVKETKALIEEANAIYDAFKTGKEHKGLKGHQLQLEVMRALRLEYKRHLRKYKL
jgi:hypothetical protein